MSGGALRDRLRPHRPAALLFVLLAIVHTWPLATSPAVLSRNDNGDAQLNEWILAWIVHQLPRDPGRLFDANIFYPAANTLAFSEPLIVPALMGAPVVWLGGSPVLTHNLLLLLGLALSGLAAYAVVFAWTRDRLAAIVAGSLFAFNTHTLTRLAHLQAMHAYGLPLALLAIDRLIRLPDRRAAAWLALTLASMAYTSGYLFVFASLMVPLALLARVVEWRLRWRRITAATILAVLAAAVLILPVALPYRRAAVEQGMVRSVESVREYSATIRGYAAAAGRVHFTTWSARFFDNPVDAFFPGVTAVAFAGYAVWRSRRSHHASRVLMLCSIGAAGFVLSLGLQTPVYAWLYAIFPPMQGLRAAARFGGLVLLAVALLAGLGVWAARQAPRCRPWRTPIGVLAALLVNVEALRAPFEYRRFEGISNIYAELAKEPGPVVLAETPFYPPQAVFENAEYVLNSTAHWRPLMNGYSGYTPESYRRVAWTFWYFPREHAIEAMREAGVTHFTVHPHRFGHEADETIAALARRTDVELIAVAARRGPRLYRFR